MAAGAIIVPLALIVAALAMGGGGKKDDKVKVAYDAGYAAGKADKENGRSATVFAEPKNAAEKAYVQGYADGYAAGVVKGGGGGGPDPKKPQLNGKDTETLTQAYNRGLANGQADGLQDGSAGNAYGAHHTASSYTRTDLRNSYEKGWEAAYGAAYAAGKKKAEDDGGIVMGDVLGYQGHDPRQFKPHTNLARRGLPREWYNM